MSLSKLTKSYRSLVLLAFFFGAATVAMNLGLQSTSSYLIAKAAQHPATILLLWTPIVAVRFFGTARAGFRYVDRYFSHDVTLRWLRDLKTSLYRAIELKSSSDVKAYASGDLMTRVSSDIDNLQNLIVGLYEPLFIGGVGILLVLGIGLLINTGIAVALALMVLISGTLLAWSSSYLARVSSQALIDLRSRLSAMLVQALHGITDIWALNLVGHVDRDVRALQIRIQDAKARLARLSGFFSGLAVLLSWGGMWLLLQIGIIDVNHHHMRPILLPVVALTALASFEIVSSLPSAFQNAGGLHRAMARVTQISKVPVMREGVQRTSPAAGVPELQFQGVTARAANRAGEILTDVSFTLRAGQHTALIGPNGSGKSTIVTLAAGLVSCHQGRVALDHTALQDWDLEAASRELGVVNQFPYVFHTSLLQNLLIARPAVSRRDIDWAIDMAGMAPLVENLPEGLDTILGERGTSLSGGELKRLAIARVILKGAPILLLDEPTEGLDPLSARAVMESLMAWASQRTVLWVTHSLVNLDLIDDIMILAAGRVVGRGPRSQMMSHRIAEDLKRFAALPS